MRAVGSHFFLLFFLCVDGVLFCYRVVFFLLVFLARVFFVLVIERCVVHMTFTDAVFVAFTYEFDESFL